MARILLCSLMGFPFVFRDLVSFRFWSSWEALGGGISEGQERGIEI